MADVFLEFLRRYANTLTLRSPRPRSAPLPDIYSIDVPASLAALAGNDYNYVGTKLLDLTYEGYSYTPLGLGYVNDPLILTDSLMFTEDITPVTYSSAIAATTKVWVLIDSEGVNQYIPVRQDYYHLIRQYLPHIKYWVGKDKGEVYPQDEYYLEADLGTWPEVYELVVDEIAHPYAKGLYLSGYAFMQTDGVVNYEYVDLDGAYGEEGVYYLSSLRPPGLDFPLGRPKGGDLVKDLCIGELGWYPYSGTEYWVGKYMGYRTSPSYHPLVTYYLYEREDRSVFLCEGGPHPDAWLWVKNALQWGEMVLQVEPSLDWVVYEEYSCGVTLLLEDASLIPVTYQYPFVQDDIGDCALLDDTFILRGGRRFIKFVDDLFPVADLLFFNDMH